MYILVLASQKGGSGKTTLSGHLAVEAQNAGVGGVALIDTDPQGSLSHWWNARAAREPLFAKVGLLELGEALEHLNRSGVKLTVIDTPPAITESISSVVSHADLVILPTRPSPHDLRAVGATVDIADRHGRPVLFVINAATPRARITGEAAVALSQHGTVAPVTIHHRVDFAASMVDGRTVGEVMAKSASAKEIRELWIYVQDRLARIKHDAAFAPKVVPQNFAISGLSAADGSEHADGGGSVGSIGSAFPPLPTPEAYPGDERRSGLDRRGAAVEPYTGIERRSGLDRREAAGEPRRVFGSGDRPAPPPFGRRNADPRNDESIRETRP
jgi:chromosome partitioning protein